MTNYLYFSNWSKKKKKTEVRSMNKHFQKDHNRSTFILLQVDNLGAIIKIKKIIKEKKNHFDDNSIRMIEEHEFYHFSFQK